jgi:transposase InsO family protein
LSMAVSLSLRTTQGCPSLIGRTSQTVTYRTFNTGADNVERYNRTVRHEWLDLTIFESIAHAQETATQWLWRYNTERPNTAIGGMTPHRRLAMVA